MIEVNEKHEESIKQSYENRIITLENKLKDDNLKIKSLTEEKVNIRLYIFVFSFHIATILKRSHVKIV